MAPNVVLPPRFTPPNLSKAPAYKLNDPPAAFLKTPKSFVNPDDGMTRVL